MCVVCWRIRLIHWGRMTHIYVSKTSQHWFRLLECCWLDHGRQISKKFYSKYNGFHKRKWLWKCRPENGGYFVSTSMCLETCPHCWHPMWKNGPLYGFTVMWSLGVLCATHEQWGCRDPRVTESSNELQWLDCKIKLMAKFMRIT